MDDLKIEKVYDVGAHDGGYGRQLRMHGYRGAIVSFEPLATAFEKLRKCANLDGNWEIKRTALGRESGEAAINVSEHLTSSSFLGMSEVHKRASPGSSYQGVEIVSVARLDSLATPSEIIDSPSWFKVDVQGFEKQVLDGSGLLLREFAAIELELSMVEVYEDGPLIEDVIAYLRSFGFSPCSFENVLVESTTARVLQVDCIFLRNR